MQGRVVWYIHLPAIRNNVMPSTLL